MAAKTPHDYTAEKAELERRVKRVSDYKPVPGVLDERYAKNINMAANMVEKEAMGRRMATYLGDLSVADRVIGTTLYESESERLLSIILPRLIPTPLGVRGDNTVIREMTWRETSARDPAKLLSPNKLSNKEDGMGISGTSDAVRGVWQRGKNTALFDDGMAALALNRHKWSVIQRGTVFPDLPHERTMHTVARSLKDANNMVLMAQTDKEKTKWKEYRQFWLDCLLGGFLKTETKLGPGFSWSYDSPVMTKLETGKDVSKGPSGFHLACYSLFTIHTLTCLGFDGMAPFNDRRFMETLMRGVWDGLFANSPYVKDGKSYFTNYDVGPSEFDWLDKRPDPRGRDFETYDSKTRFVQSGGEFRVDANGTARAFESADSAASYGYQIAKAFMPKPMLELVEAQGLPSNSEYLSAIVGSALLKSGATAWI